MLLKPKLPYRGLTVVMANPSRMDRSELLSGTAGWWFRNECLLPEIAIQCCEVRSKEERGPLLPNTKVLLLLGKEAFDLWTGNAAQHTLGEIRGSIFYVNGIPAIPSYLPQDCMDAKDYESIHNELLQGKDYSEEGAIDSEKSEKRRHGVTARTNWRFWLQKDTAKAIRILHNGGQIPETVGSFKPTYHYYPAAHQVIQELDSATDKQIYLDIETDANLGLKCIGYSVDSPNISVIPIFDYEYKRAYPELPQILRAFCLAASRNTLVSHNGSGFDWPVLAWKYKMMVGPRFYDTMLAMHRCFPDIEKSLGHGTSLWTYEPFHKDEGSMQYGTISDMRQLMAYCGKDVYTMMLIRRAIDHYARSIPGLTESIAQVNASVHPYLLTMLQGMHYKQHLLDEIMAENDELMMQYNRIINFLIGERAIKELNKTSKKSVPGSNSKCCRYFHDMLGYPVVAKSKKTGAPSLAKKALYKLRLKHENPVIDFTLNYREVAKESGSLKFEPWMK